MKRVVRPITAGNSCPDLRSVGGVKRLEKRVAPSPPPSVRSSPRPPRRLPTQATLSAPVHMSTPPPSPNYQHHHHHQQQQPLVSPLSFQNCVWSANSSPVLSLATPLHFPPSPPDINAIYELNGMNWNPLLELKRFDNSMVGGGCNFEVNLQII